MFWRKRATIDLEPPVTLEVTRGQRGAYGWSIEVHGVEDSRVLQRVLWLDKRLREELEREAIPEPGAPAGP